MLGYFEKPCRGLPFTQWVRKQGGENISCIKVESAIYAHKGVAEVAVFGLPDDRLGEVVAAIVHLKPGISLDAQQLRAFMAGQLAAYKIPAYLEFSEEPLPRTGTDKIFQTPY